MRQRELKVRKRPLRLDRRVEPDGHGLPVFDLDLIQRGFRESLLVAGLFRRPAKYLRGPSGAAR
jgi:hypothetical protein